MSKTSKASRLGDAAVYANNVVHCQTEVMKLKCKVIQRRTTSGLAQQELLNLLSSAPSNKERKAMAQIIAIQFGKGRVDTGDLSPDLCDAMKNAGVAIYPPGRLYKKSCDLPASMGC